jgi:hypothetical protein
MGARIVWMSADMSQRDAVADVLQACVALGPLRGIVHSAGALADGAILQQRWERFAVPLGAKIDGAWALHELTRGARLDFFILYSSVASVVGSSGQSNHSAANAFMDSLAAYRHRQGLPALSIGWGAWSEIGAAADRQVDQRVASQGVDVIPPARGLRWLEHLSAGAEPHVAVFPVRWKTFLSGSRAMSPFYSRIGGAGNSGRQEAAVTALSTPVVAELRDELRLELRDASESRRHEILLRFVGDHVARVLGASHRNAIDVDQPLNELGLDSLMAVELRNRLGTGLGLARSLPATLVFDHPTLQALAQHLSRHVVPGTVAAPAATDCVLAAVAPGDAIDAIDELSDEEIEKLFAKRMQGS